MEFSFMTHYDRRTMTVLARVLRKTLRAGQNRMIRLIGLFIVAFAIFLALPTDGHFSPLDLLTTLLPAVIILLVMVYEDSINGYFAARRVLPEARQVLSAFNEQGYRTATGMGDTVWRYENIAQVVETPLYFVFLFDRSHAQLYDKTSIEGGTSEEFRSFIQEQTGKIMPFIK